MAFDANRLRLGERIAGGSALLLLIDMFLRWYSFKSPVGISGQRTSVGFSAWDAFGGIDLLLLLIILAVAALVAMRGLQARSPLPLSPSVLIAALGAIATLLVLFRLIAVPDFLGLDLSRSYGVVLGLIFSAGIAYGGFRGMQDEGTSLQDARAQAEAAVSSRGQGSSSPGTPGSPGSSGSSTIAPSSPPVAPPPPAGAPPAGGVGTPPPPADPPPPPADPPAGQA